LTTTGSGAPVQRPGRARGRAARPGLAFGVGQLLVGVGGIAIIVSIFLKWEDLTLASRHQTAKAKDIPIQFLFNYTTHASDPSFVVILAASAALCLVGVLLSLQAPGLRTVAMVGALAAIFTGAMYSFQVHQALHGLGLGSIHTTDFVGPAPYAAVGGGVVALVGAVLPLPKR
jgi:hypothetical protein